MVRESDADAHFRELNAQALGVFDAYLIRREHVPVLMDRAEEGDDAEALRLLLTIQHCMARIRGEPPLRCLLCAERVCRHEDMAAIFALFPGNDDPTRGVANIVCESCATQGHGLEKIIERIRKFNPGVKVVDVFSEPGHA